ncbi:MAG: 3-hydroxyacyl-CoA dehydrogenase family protein [Dehalococcoidia bacterium]
MTIKSVGVAGCGIMGGGIAQVCASHGYDVTVLELNQQLVDKGFGGIKRRLGRDVEKERLSQEDCDGTLGRLKGTTDIKDLSACDLIIEAIDEDLPAKQQFFAELGRVCKPEAILASNTSSLSLSIMAAASGRPEKVVGLHFFNPPMILRLVEVISTQSSSQDSIDGAVAFCDTIGRVVVRTKDTPGFIVNRLLVPFVFDAIRMVESGTATAEDVDQACKAGLNHVMGPIATADLVGLDTLAHIGDSMFEDFGEPRFKTPTMLRRMVSLGHLGRKSGKGFFDYSA